jgi:hypothetical protein
MSYKTNAKALRLGISGSWSLKASGPTPQLHLEHKLMRYVTNLVEHAVPQAPQRAKTKGRTIAKPAVAPGLQGRTLAVRGGSSVTVLICYYLSLDGAETAQVKDMELNLRQIRWLLAQESGYRVVLLAFNYFLYFWRMKLMRGRRRGRGAGSIRQAIDKFPFLTQERLSYAAQTHRVRRTRRALKRWRRQRFHQRSFYPICASFLSADFDGALASKVIALELQILRIYHKRFMRYMRSFLGFCWRHWNRDGLLEGLRLEVRGRMTDHRRQVRRAQTKTWRWGMIKKADLRVEANHHRQLAYNRYGVISVSFTYQHRALAAERWDDRMALTPLRGFALRSLVEAVGEERETPPPARLGLLRNPGYLAEPFTLLDRSSALERLQRSSGFGGAEGSEAGQLLAQLPALELLNRCGYYQYRLEEHRRRLQGGAYHRMLLRARPVLHTPRQGFSPRYQTPPAPGGSSHPAPAAAAAAATGSTASTGPTLAGSGAEPQCPYPGGSLVWQRSARA